MARSSLFGEILREAGYGAAQGMGATGMDIASRQRRADEQFLLSRKMRREDDADALAREVAMHKMGKTAGADAPIELADLSARDAYLGNNQPAESLFGTSLPPASNDDRLSQILGQGFADGILGGDAAADRQFPMEFPGLSPDGELPPPVMMPNEEAMVYLDQFEGQELNPEGQKGLIRLKKIAEQLEPGNLMPQAQEELLNTFRNESSRLRLEKKVIPPPPTPQQEVEMRTVTLPDGSQAVMNPTKEGGNRIEAHPNQKVQIEEMRLSQQRESTMAQQQQAAQAQQQKDATVQQEQADTIANEKKVAKEADQKKQFDERRKRFDKHYGDYYTKNTAEELNKDARDAWMAAHKVKHGNKQTREPTTQEIDAIKELRHWNEFQQSESASEAKDRALKGPKPTPFDEVSEFVRANPQDARKRMDAIETELADKKLSALEQSDPEAADAYIGSGTMPPVSRGEIFDVMANEMPSALESELERWKQSRLKPRPLMQAAANSLGKGKSQPGPASTVVDRGGSRPADAFTIPAADAAPASIPAADAAPVSQPDVDFESPEFQQQLRGDIAKAMNLDPDKVPKKEIDRQLAIPRLLRDAATGLKSRNDGKYIQDIPGGIRDEVLKDAQIIVDGEDFDALSPGQLGVDAETGKIYDKPPLSPKAAEIAKGKGKYGMHVVMSQSQLDALPDGESFINGYTDTVGIKNKKSTFSKESRSAIGEYLSEQYDTVAAPIARQFKTTLFGK